MGCDVMWGGSKWNEKAVMVKVQGESEMKLDCRVERAKMSGEHGDENEMFLVTMDW